jgi:hypothetical protein
LGIPDLLVRLDPLLYCFCAFRSSVDPAAVAIGDIYVEDATDPQAALGPAAAPVIDASPFAAAPSAIPPSILAFSPRPIVKGKKHFTYDLKDTSLDPESLAKEMLKGGISSKVGNRPLTKPDSALLKLYARNAISHILIPTQTSYVVKVD